MESSQYTVDDFQYEYEDDDDDDDDDDEANDDEGKLIIVCNEKEKVNKKHKKKRKMNNAERKEETIEKKEIEEETPLPFKKRKLNQNLGLQTVGSQENNGDDDDDYQDYVDCLVNAISTTSNEQDIETSAYSGQHSNLCDKSCNTVYDYWPNYYKY